MTRAGLSTQVKIQMRADLVCPVVWIAQRTVPGLPGNPDHEERQAPWST
jgi:hypothetical protein